jgi:lipopolysaccharide export system permease protein
MRIIDRYIIRQFLLTSFFSLIAVIVIFVVIDAMEHLDDFLDQQASFNIILLYYLFFVPEIVKLVTPVALLLASLFVTARLSTQSELTAMKAGGISLYRLMVPYLLVAVVVSGASIYFNGWLVPLANKKKFDIGRVYLHKEVISASGANIYIQDSRTRILSLGYYDEGRTVATRVSIQDFDPQDLTRMVHRIDANNMSWDSTARVWILHAGMERTFENGVERIRVFDIQPAGKLNFDPEDLRKKQEKPDEMEYYTLKEFIESQQRAGQDVARWQVDFYSKISFPFASVVVVLFGVPFSSIKRRSGTGVQLGISLLICFLYLIFMKISQVFGYNGDINPLLTAWLANIASLIAAVIVILRVRK